MITTNDFRTEVRNVIWWAANECKRQQSGEQSVARMVAAYVHLLELQNFVGLAKIDKLMILQLGELVDQQNSTIVFRVTPVTFASGGNATKPEHIDRQIQLLLAEQGSLEPKEWVKRFLEIHPFKDGNGRVAALLYNFLKGDLEAPQPLPVFDFMDPQLNKFRQDADSV